MKNKNWVFILIVLISLFSCFLFSQESLAATTQGMVVYSTTSKLGIPCYRLWNGTSWTEERYAQQVSTTAAIRWVVLKQCPMRNEYILGTLDADNDLNIQVYNVAADTWSNLREVTTTCDSRFRGFDIAYEYSSGQGLIVFHTDNTVGDATRVPDPQYYIWNGTSYDGPYTLDIPAWVSDSPVSGGTKGSPAWIRLKPWPTDSQTSDSIMLGILTDYENSGTSVKDYEVYYCIWRGTVWETSTALKQLNAYSYNSTTAGGEGMDLLTYHCKDPNFRGVTYPGYAYAMGRWTELYKKIGSPYYNHLLYSEYKVNSPASWGSVLYPSYPRLAAATHFYWQRTSNRAPKKDTTSYIDSILGAVDSASKLQLSTIREVAGAGLSFSYINPVSATNVSTLTSRCFDVAMESSQNEGILVWGETGNSSFRYAYVNLPAVTWSGVLSGKNVGIANVVSLAADPESDDLMLATINSTSGLYLTKWDGSANSWGTALQLAATTSCNTYEPVAVVFKSYNPPPELKQNNYRWYANTDALQPATGLAGENTAVSVADGTIVRLRMSVGVTSADLTTPEKFALEFSTSTLGPWQRLAPAGTGKFWNRQTPDAVTGANFTQCELALDPSDQPHIAYIDGTNQRIKYTYWTGSCWGSKTNPNAPEIIPTGYTVYDSPNIVFDSSGNSHLAYCCDSDGDGLSDLGYCKWTGSSWNIQVPLLDSQSLAGNKLGSRTAMDLDSSNKPHIGHRDFSTLGYTKYDGASWSAEKLLDSATVCVSNDYMGFVIDSVNNIHIAYNENATANTKYVKWTGSSWTSPVVIDSSGYNAYSMDVNSNNYPYLMIGGNRLLKWNGSSWATENLSAILSPSGASTSKGNNGVSIRMDANNNPHVVYEYKDDNLPKKRGVRYAWYDGTWHDEIVEETYGESDSYLLRPREFDWDSDGLPHVAYARTIDGISRIRYATKIDPSGFRGYDNPAPADGDTITGCLLTGSSVRESYEEVNSSAAMPNTISADAYGEWDWVIKIEGAAAGTTYYFRMVKDNDDPLNEYIRYPELTVSSGTPQKSKITHWEEVR